MPVQAQSCSFLSYPLMQWFSCISGQVSMTKAKRWCRTSSLFCWKKVRRMAISSWVLFSTSVLQLHRDPRLHLPRPWTPSLFAGVLFNFSLSCFFGLLHPLFLLLVGFWHLLRDPLPTFPIKLNGSGHCGAKWSLGFLNGDVSYSSHYWDFQCQSKCSDLDARSSGV